MLSDDVGTEPIAQQLVGGGCSYEQDAGGDGQRSHHSSAAIAMEQLFTNLSHAVEGAPLLALGASAAWGVLSIILSPCHLASLPLIVGFISGQGRVSTARACGIATLFAVGILVTIAAIGTSGVPPVSTQVRLIVVDQLIPVYLPFIQK